MSLDDVLAELRKTYLAGLPARADLISGMWKEGRLSDVETEFHKLKGTGKTYGIAEVSQIGEMAEHLCEHGDAVAAQSVPLALGLLRKVHDAKSKGAEFKLETDADFQTLTQIRSKLTK